MGAVSMTEAHKALAERLTPTALKHCESVSETACALAETYGVDTGAAQLAGLLHDWSREDGDAQILEDAAAAGFSVDSVDVEVPYLLHARTGAHALKEAFPGIDSEVVDAVSRHTLGDVEMTDLDRVVYVADMIEPGREYRGVDKLRGAVGEIPLSELFARAYAQSLKHVIRKRKRLHPAAVAVWNAIADASARDCGGER